MSYRHSFPPGTTALVDVAVFTASRSRTGRYRASAIIAVEIAHTHPMEQWYVRQLPDGSPLYCSPSMLRPEDRDRLLAQARP